MFSPSQPCSASCHSLHPIPSNSTLLSLMLAQQSPFLRLCCSSFAIEFISEALEFANRPGQFCCSGSLFHCVFLHHSAFSFVFASDFFWCDPWVFLSSSNHQLARVNFVWRFWSLWGFRVDLEQRPVSRRRNSNWLPFTSSGRLLGPSTSSSEPQSEGYKA